MLAACLVAMAANGTQAAPKTFVESPRALLESCPAGHRIEFRFGAISLHVDPHWLEDLTLQRLATRFRNQCPGVPIELAPASGLAAALDFNRSVVAAAHIEPPDLGRHYFQLIIASIPPPSGTPATSVPQTQADEPALVDVTAEVPRPPSARVYELRYPQGDAGTATTVRISCGGSAPESGKIRTCFTVEPYRYRGTLSVRYSFRQEQLPLPEARPAMPSAVMTEPEGVRAFDARLRAWIDSIMRP